MKTNEDFVAKLVHELKTAWKVSDSNDTGAREE